mmetsp:Transcript_140719/g.392225  ORF Transcript_140719/g.392225 Transcript_140719/m.392225 type:complete len:124 (-) Transcript_140719:1328-1699(-)
MPSDITTILAALLMVANRWAITMVVHAEARMTSSSACCTTCSLSTSSALVASSSNRTLGLFTIARAMAMRCFWPPLSCTPRSPTSVERPSGSCLMNSHAFARMHTSCNSVSSITNEPGTGMTP